MEELPGRGGESGQGALDGTQRTHRDVQGVGPVNKCLYQSHLIPVSCFSAMVKIKDFRTLILDFELSLNPSSAIYDLCNFYFFRLSSLEARC